MALLDLKFGHYIKTFYTPLLNLDVFEAKKKFGALEAGQKLQSSTPPTISNVIQTTQQIASKLFIDKCNNKGFDVRPKARIQGRGLFLRG